MNRMYFFKHVLAPAPNNNLKIINEAGEELSLSADDSCGVLKNYSRFCMARFSDETRKQELCEEKLGVDPEEFLMALAEHLGYDVKKMDEDVYEKCIRCGGNLLDRAERKSGYCSLCKSIG